MENRFHYGTVTEAIAELRKKGFSLDFNLEENCIVCGQEKFEDEDFEIVEVYRYEGDSDPGDEALVYGIQLKSGLKGILVTSYGTYVDGVTSKILEKLHF